MTNLVDRKVGIFSGSLWASAAVAGVPALAAACGGKGNSAPPPSMNAISGPWGVTMGDNRIALVVLPDGSFRSLAVIIKPGSTVPPNMTMLSGSFFVEDDSTGIVMATDNGSTQFSGLFAKI